MSHPIPSRVRQLLSDFCARKGLKLVSDPKIGYAGFIQDRNGQRRFYKGTHFDLNTLGAAEVSDDKAYALKFLKRDGFRVPESLLLYVAGKKIEKPITLQVAEFSERVGYPLFVKPNGGQEGKDVVKVRDRDELDGTLRDLCARHNLVLLQQAVKGIDLRIVVLDGVVLCAIERHPPQVLGDGNSKIEELLTGLVQIKSDDPRILRELAQQGLDFDSIPAEGQPIRLLPNANLSAGGTGEIVTQGVGQNHIEAAVNAAKCLGLRYAGIDMMVDDVAGKTPGYTVLEANAAPGLNHLAAQSDEDAKAVADLYEAVFLAMAQGLQLRMTDRQRPTAA
ncbi:cyanophycin synthetase [Roseibium hamelinense]|uniref:Cyanophycin synthetase n=1 Tax=Roseibium hamelinense TaxID=150831 RepID=A0A562SNC6_9HYPH|nr:ATP-grasp domain-containing protein [Roseibium hamelinense]MTI44050.1 ATP-grasp domain-containing protein [Roseibium hamelinense]TWI82742.1 cyanophycin synthetase [Roseibium hamelinense]